MDTPAVLSARARAALRPYITAITAPVTRAAGKIGVDLDSLVVDELRNDPELASTLVDAARRALSLARLNSSPIDVPVPTRDSAMARGHRRPEMHVAKNPSTGQVKYPTGYRDKPDAPRATGFGPCSSSQLATIASVVARVRSTLSQIPESYQGQPYRELVEEYIDDVWDANYCFDQAYCTKKGKAVCYGGFRYTNNDDSGLAFGPGFFAPGLAALIDPADFQAGIVVHELVHMIDSGESVADGSCEECGDACSAREHRAAYVQARYMGISSCGANMFACAYGRLNADVPAAENALATITAFFECYLGAATVLEVLALVALSFVDPLAAVSVLGIAGLALAALVLVFVFDAWT